MDPYLRIIDNELILPGVKGEHVFFHVSDTHICASDELSTPEEAENAAKWEANWMRGKEGFAKSFGEPFGDAQRISTVEGFEKILSFAEQQGLLLRGTRLLNLGDGILPQGSVKELLHACSLDAEGIAHASLQLLGRESGDT